MNRLQSRTGILYNINLEIFLEQLNVKTRKKLFFSKYCYISICPLWVSKMHRYVYQKLIGAVEHNITNNTKSIY